MTEDNDGEEPSVTITATPDDGTSLRKRRQQQGSTSLAAVPG